MDYNYLLEGEENLAVIMLDSYKDKHPDAFKTVVTRTENGDGSRSMHLNQGELEKVLDAAIKEYSDAAEKFDPKLAEVFRRIDARQFLLERGEDYHGDFYHYVGEKM